MNKNPAGMLYIQAEAGLTTKPKPPKEETSGFFSRGGLQKNSLSEPAEIAQAYFERLRKAREDFNNG